MSAGTAERHVRVTVEGNARPLGHDPRLLRLVQPSGRTVLVDTESAGVTVEDVPREWVWSEGDVVRGTTIVYRRDHLGVWHGVGPGGQGGFQLDDDMVSEGAGKPTGYDVLVHRRAGA